ncbi:MAG: DUF4476 domain-containing protein [Bacteroidales bacterium]|nr:DUF4476 domain-containing protein [Bacteroidales bacterium]
MRKFFIVLFAFLALPAMAQIQVYHGGNHSGAQQSTLSVTTSNHQGFWLFVDDILQNENPVRSISIQNMPASDYYIRVEMNNNEHNCVGQFVNFNRPQSFEFAQRNGFYGLIAIQGGFRPELAMSLISATPQNGQLLPPPVPGNNVGMNPTIPLPPPAPGNNMGMNPVDFNQAKELIRNESFDNSRLALAKQVVSGNGMNAAQITEICKLFSFENNALEFAKYAYQYCTEPNKYYLVNEAFKYDSSKRELNDYINGK